MYKFKKMKLITCNNWNASKTIYYYGYHGYYETVWDDVERMYRNKTMDKKNK